MEKHDQANEQYDTEMRNIIEEARVVLPGIQALFGFQIIAVFNDRFEELANYAKACHAAGLIMVIISVAMVMAPAIHYRTAGGHATASMTRLSSRLIRGALFPLALGLALDMFTVFHVVSAGMSERMMLSIGAALGTLVLLSGLWFYVPRRERSMRRTQKLR
ncbi:DUF6328 family protein [Massilia sp. IC2-477]|uniref:DUF6328 family protein n=1 Tax=Massilia sp. IC2-477 TaxID=2887198 RepID=UPI001D112B51|nr:DUF6328 family protein [Massilia sp. IC2-477]MCC2958815.1 DUF6328 family protein [Massilia sp. IC2-477]